MPQGGNNKGKGAALAWIKAHTEYQGDECLPWPFSGNWNGYGHLGINGKSCKAHRTMCELAHGPPPTPKYVAAHSCHNPPCVNPKHLSWKTPRENLLDRRKDRTLTKKRWHNRGLLSDSEVALICLLKPYCNQREIGAIFGISYQHVSIIQQGKLKRQRKSA